MLTTHAQTARSTLSLDNQSGQLALVKLIGPITTIKQRASIWAAIVSAEAVWAM